MYSITQPYLTLCDSIDCSPLGSSVHEFPKQSYWNGLPFPSPENLPNPGIKLVSLVPPASSVLAGGFFTTMPSGKPLYLIPFIKIVLNELKTFFKEKSKTFKNLGGTFRWVWRFVFNTRKATGEITKGKSMQIYASPSVVMGLPRWLRGKESTCHAEGAGDKGLITGWGRSPGEGQYSCLENPRDRGAWWATVHGVVKNWTRLKQLNTHTRANGVVMNQIQNQGITWEYIGHKYYN